LISRAPRIRTFLNGLESGCQDDRKNQPRSWCGPRTIEPLDRVKMFAEFRTR
jgi:hypothetical protein